MSPIKNSAATLVTAIHYRDVEAAAAWLQAAFGFDLRTNVMDEDGRAGMIQLTYGNHLIMVLPAGGPELDNVVRQPDGIGGAGTQSCYLVVDEVVQHHNRAQAAGADVVSALKAFDRGGLGYSCRDLEGHLWNFGTYDPWSEPSGRGVRSPPVVAGKRLPVLASLAALAGVVALIGVGLGLWHPFARSTVAEDRLVSQLKVANDKAEQAVELAARSTADLAKERATRKSIAFDAQRARLRQALERSARATAENSLQQSEINHAAERSAKNAAKDAAAAANAAAARERTSREAAERTAAAVRSELTLATAAKLKAERAAKETAEQLVRERVAREAAENLAKEAQNKLKQAQAPAGGAAKSPKPAATTKKAATTPNAAPSSLEPLPALLP
jgi:uncharacterized glyoxalase superfamily protein PhnB